MFFDEGIGGEYEKILASDGDLFMENSKGLIQALYSSWDISF